MQVLSPDTGFEKYQVGQQVTITWHTAGLTLESPVALIDAGGGPVDDFSAGGLYRTDGGGGTDSTTNAIDTSGVTNPAPGAVYQTEAEANPGVGSALSYDLAVPDGTYTIRLDFAELDGYQPGDRVFDIQLQGQTVLAGYDIAAAAGGDDIATAETFTVTASGGNGIKLSLVNDTYEPAVLAGIEVFAANPNGAANPTVNLDVSPDGGGTWISIATGLAMDAYGNGSYDWTIPSNLPLGNQYLVRVTANEGTNPVGVSAQPFLITNNGNAYYVNANTTAGGAFTTAPGNDANSGKSPDQPMASLTALLAAYTLQPGDIVYVDTGTYNLIKNVVLGPEDSGVTFEGPAGGGALLNRGNTNQGEYVFDLQGATDVTLENLEITGGSYGINASDGAGSTGLTVSNSILDGNLNAGAYIGVGNDNPTFVNDTIYGDPANLYVSASQPEGLGIDANGAVVTGNTIFDSSESGLSVYGSNVQVTGNTVYGNETGIFISGSGVVSGNKVFDNEYNIYASSYSGLLSVLDNAVYGSIGTNSSGGIYASNATVTGNAVYGILGTGIEAADSTIVEENQVYDNTGDGILAESADDTISGNHVYANNIGIDVEDLDYATGLVVSNNVVEGNATYGIHAAVNSYGGNTALQLLNNTVIQETGNAIQVDSGSNNVQLLNNILWAQSGYDILVAPDSEVGFQSDYNDLYTTGMGQIGWWEGQSFSSVADWYYELGLDGHSITSEPQFVDPAGPDGIMGYSAAPVGSPQVIDTSSASGFSTTGSWTVNNGGGYAGSYLTTPAGDGSTTASWTFSGLTPGATYEIAVSWPTNASESDYYNSYNAPFTVLDSGLPIGLQRVDQVYPPNVEGVPTVADNGTVFQVLGTFQVTGTSLTVVLSNEANGTVEADAAWLQQIVGNHGADDNFHLLPSSPAVAAGEPNSAFFEEPSPNAGRVDLGAYGNTPQATLSPPQVVQVLSPDTGFEKYQVGQQVTITWHTAGLTLESPVALIDAGGGPVDDFSAGGLYRTDGGGGTDSTTNAIDTSGVTNPAPGAVYQTEAEANPGVGSALSYDLAVPDGTYTIRLDFAELDGYQPGDRVFDIQLQGQTVLAGYDIAAAAGGDDIATAETFTVTASGGNGIKLSLVNDTYEPAVLAGIEVFAANPNGAANPTVNLDVSPDGGGTWISIATGLAMDAYGNGSYDWTIPSNLPLGNQYLVRVTANEGTNPVGVSAQPFLITNNGNAYYVNANTTAGGAFTTAPGNDANSGTSPDHPMATLAALLETYPLGPGDTIYVDNGSYSLYRTIVLGPDDSGITIEGPAGGSAVLDRGNTNADQYVFDLQGATNVTLNSLQITGGLYGINASDGAGSTGLTVSTSTLFDNQQYGAYIGVGNDNFTFRDDAIYGEPGAGALSQPIGLQIGDENGQLIGRLIGNDVYTSTTGIDVLASGVTLSDNDVYASTTGIYVYASTTAIDGAASGVTLSDNTVHDNSQYGIDAIGAVISGNIVYGQVLPGAEGIYAVDSQVVSNTVYTNAYGIYDAYGNVVSQNRLYNNSAAAIYSASQTTNIESNYIYSNAVGIDASASCTGLIGDNLIYANSTAAITIETNPNYGAPIWKLPTTPSISRLAAESLLPVV